MASRPKIAAVVSTYYPASHADVILTKLVRGIPTDEGLLPPQVEIAGLYMDQLSERDVGLGLAREHGITVFPSIPQALCLGGSELAVDGVIAIAEHGDYAWNEKGQQLYPRRHFLEQICGVIATAGRPIPVFSDKHLAYSWQDSKWMYDRTRQLQVPFLAGSSIPLFWRDPWLEHELGTPIEAALALSYGELEAYGFHGLEGLQCMVERRRGGETGIRAVQCLTGPVAGRDPRWSRPLAQAALAQVDTNPDMPAPSLEELGSAEDSALFILEYRDGLTAALLQPNGYGGYVRGWGYAAQVGGQVQATGYHSCRDPFPHFSYLALNIQDLFLKAVPPYPVERTLLVSGALDALMESHHRGGVRLETPHLEVVYSAVGAAPIRPRGPRPVGASTQPMHQWS